ncbi:MULTISPECIES: 3-hydroxyacyl-CoA dehydrogenase family protein [unclassified Brachybacterium]|uniref:3-hydroxyacyl-CoA dehydrogenase family protein n=1 Tax=unclassified Brachybacterium TaxID=2623841 RepID=UPI004033F71E
MTISTVTIVGAGYMGGGIAQVLASAGFEVTIADVSVENANASLERLQKEARDFEEQGLYGPGSADLVAKNITAGKTLEDAVADVDFIEEAVFERLDVKREVLGKISEHARPDAIIGTNTSTIPVRELESAVKNPERFLTVHFSNPAPFIPGVELVAGRDTTPEAVAAVKELLEKSGNQGAQVADTPGMVLNRLQYALLKEATAVVEEGIATAEDVDTIVRTTFGFRLGFFGPFAIADQAGLGVYASGFATLETAFGSRMAIPQILADAIAEDREGVKNGKGLLGDYDAEAAAELVSYRNKAYAKMSQLLAELGPAPHAHPARELRSSDHA